MATEDHWASWGTSRFQGPQSVRESRGRLLLQECQRKKGAVWVGAGLGGLPKQTRMQEEPGL